MPAPKSVPPAEAPVAAATPAEGATPGPKPAKPKAEDEKPSRGAFVFDALPEFPGTPDLSEVVKKVFKTGIKREEIEAALKALDAGAENAGKDIGAEAAKELLTFLNSKAVAFDIGRAFGTIVGFVVGEVLVAVFTEGIGNVAAKAVQIAKGALEGGKIVAKLAGLLEKLRVLLEPVIKMLVRFGEEAAKFVAKIPQVDRRGHPLGRAPGAPFGRLGREDAQEGEEARG